MTASLLQSVSHGATAASASLISAFAADVTAGSLILMHLTSGGSVLHTAPTASGTAVLSPGITNIQGAAGGSGSTKITLSLWYAVVTTGGSLTLTFSNTDAIWYSLIEEFSGLQSSPLEAGAAVSSNFTNTAIIPSVTSGTTTNANDLIVESVASTTNSGQPTQTSPWTSDIGPGQTVADGLQVAFQTVAATGAYTTSWSVAAAHTVTIIAAFKIASASFLPNPAPRLLQAVNRASTY